MQDDDITVVGMRVASMVSETRVQDHPRTEPHRLLNLNRQGAIRRAPLIAFNCVGVDKTVSAPRR
jgi:hypothetical protein